MQVDDIIEIAYNIYKNTIGTIIVNKQKERPRYEKKTYQYPSKASNDSSRNVWMQGINDEKVFISAETD